MIVKKATLYLFCLFFFKIAVGAILLVTCWDSLGISGNGLAHITLIMALSFSPAAFARPIFQKLKNVPVPKILIFSLLVASILIVVEHMFMGISLPGLFTVHFILWIFIFIIEVATEKWYVVLSQGFNLTDSRKLSGISTSVGQIGIILGPVLVMLSKLYNQSLSYWLICACFIIASVFALKAHFKTKLVTGPVSISTISEKFSTDKRFWYVLGLSLIWPTLTVFNLSIPVLAKQQFNSINVAGFLESMIAVATAIAGFTYSYIANTGKFRQRALLVFTMLFLSTTAVYLYNSNLVLVSMGIFLLGLCFGYLRVELRACLSKRFQPKEAGDIIASANSWSGLLVILYAALFYYCSYVEIGSGLTILFPLSFIISAAVFLYILNYETGEKGCIVNVV